MQIVRIYRLNDLDTHTQARLKAAQMEAARVWRYCVERHQQARREHMHWSSRDELQRETKGGQYALHSQSIQMVCQQFLANVRDATGRRSREDEIGPGLRCGFVGHRDIVGSMNMHLLA